MKTTQFTKTSLFESLGIKKDAYFESWERDIHPVLCEVALSAEQIDKLFKDIDQAKGNRTGLGKGIDAVGAAKDKISDVWFNKFGTMLQNSGPVQAFDKQYDEIKAKIRAANPDSKIIAAIDKYGEFAKKNPKMQKFIVAIAATLASTLGVALAGGFGASALAVGTGTGIATGVINIADRLLKGGEKLSTSLGRGASAGVVAGLTAFASAKVADFLFKGFNAVVQPLLEKYGIVDSTFIWNGQYWHVYADKNMAAKLKTAFDAIGSNPANFNPSAMQNFVSLIGQASTPQYMKSLGTTIDIYNTISKAADATATVMSDMYKVATTAGAAAVGTASQPDAQPAPAQAESRKPKSKSLTESEIKAVFTRVANLNNRMLSEGRLIDRDLLNEGMFDKFKTAAATVGSAVKTGAKAVGKGLGKAAVKGLGAVGKGIGNVAHGMTTKVTGNTLQKAWEKAGKPTDSVEIEKLLQAQGVNPEVIKTVFQANKIPVTIKADPATDTTAQPGATDNPEVFTPGGNRGTQQPGTPQGGTTQQPQGGTTQQPQGGATTGTTQQPGQPTATKVLPDVSKYTPQQKQQLIAMIDKALAGSEPPVKPAQPGAQQPAPAQPEQPAQAGKPHTGGRQKGGLSQSPEAIRQRQARAAKKQPATPTTAPTAKTTQGVTDLTQPTQTSTGGTVTPTATGYVHKANPNNPNLAQPQADIPLDKIKPSRGAGAPTPEEYAAFQQKLKAAKQAQGV
jgi:hypothetical protein